MNRFIVIGYTMCLLFPNWCPNTLLRLNIKKILCQNLLFWIIIGFIITEVVPISKRECLTSVHHHRDVRPWVRGKYNSEQIGSHNVIRDFRFPGRGYRRNVGSLFPFSCLLPIRWRANPVCSQHVESEGSINLKSVSRGSSDSPVPPTIHSRLFG